MKGFIEISMEGKKSIIAVDQIARCYRFGDVWVNRKIHPNSAVIAKKKEISVRDIVLDETYAEIVVKIEAATEQKSEPQQEICDDLLLAEGCSLREKLKIATEIIKSYDPDFDTHQLGAADYDQCCEDLSTPEVIRQNIYYRTADHHPSTDDTDACEQMLVSENGWAWSLIDFDEFDQEEYKFWAPCPKVEVRT